MVYTAHTSIDNPAKHHDQTPWSLWLLSEKCKRRSGALNPWSCGQGEFGRVTADLGNVALHQASSGSWRRSFSQKGSSCLVPVNRGARPEHLTHRPANHPEAGG